MPFEVVTTFEDDVVLEKTYRVQQISVYYRKMKNLLPGVEMRPVPIIPWLIGLAFEDAEKGPHKSRIKNIVINGGS
jgi:hypothetical protein